MRQGVVNGVPRNDEQITLLFLVPGIINKKHTLTLMNINELIPVMQMVRELVRLSFHRLVCKFKRKQRIANKGLADRRQSDHSF
ncbi:hypothetical protein D3C76_1515510 [compost metagenome]